MVNARSQHRVGATSSEPDGVVSLRLDNGVWLLALPTGLPALGYRGVASIQLWIGAGTAAEGRREHGCAHLLEHMVFKPHPGPGGEARDLASVIEQLGGDVNAFTSHDETVFHARVPADSFAAAMEVLVGSVVDRSFAPAQLAREQDVVIEEIRQYADDPAARAIQAMMADLYGEHAYGRPVLGEEPEVRALTPGILRAWSRRQVRGERVVVVVVGPLELDEIVARAEQLLGSLPAGKRRRGGPRPTPAGAAKVQILRGDVQEAYLRFGFMGGEGLDAQSVALDLAAVALGQGESARLAMSTRRRDQLVSDAHASYLAGLASGTFVVSAQADVDSVEAASVALLDELDGLARAPLEAGELARAKALLRSSLVYRRETVQGQAHAIGYFAMVSGRYGAEADYFETLRELSAEQVREACARCLRPEHGALTILVPRDKVSARAAKALATRLQRACRGFERRRSNSWRPAAKAPRSGPSVATRDELGTWHTTHRSGLRVIARPDPSVPVVAGWLVWPGGQRLESARDAGISSLTAALLNRGSAARGGDELAREIEGLAAVLDGFSGHNSVGLQTESLAGDFPTVLARALECVLEPSFAASELEEARRVVLADLEADADDVGHLAYRRMLTKLYGRHPLARDLRGTRESVARIDRAKIARGWSRDYGIGRGVLSLVGDFELELVLAELDRLLVDVDDGQPTAPRWPGKAPRWRQRPVVEVIEREREQGQCVIGFPGLHLGDPRGAVLDVLCTVLGGQSGRLFESLRERQGLVYQVGASSSEHIDAGHVVFYAAASQDKLDAARVAIEAEIARVCSEQVCAAELDRAKGWLVGHFESSLQRRSRVASRMVFGEAYGLGASYYLRYPARIQAVERSSLLALARELLDPRRQITVLVRS